MEIAPSYLPSPIPLPLEEDELKHIVKISKDWALMHGAGMRSQTDFKEDTLEIAPFVLIPSSFPRKEFYKAVEIQTTLNELIHKVAYDRSFLTESLKDAVTVDEFTRNLFKIYETVLKEGVAQPISLGLLRSDYMAHSTAANSIKQVELNTIASSLAGVCSCVSKMNRFVFEQLGHLDKLVNLPDNHALEGLSWGMVEAWKQYGKEEAAILFLVEDVSYNICDQRFHEFEICKIRPGTKVIRKTFTEIFHEVKSLGPKNELIVNGREVAVVYYRAGYTPPHYYTNKEWEARLTIERSKAIKCPSIQYQLAGTKKVQQTLAVKGALERFLKDPKKIEDVRQVFAGLYSLDLDESGDEAMQMGLENPERFVLKPQREGGGFNIYGSDIKTALLKMGKTKERTGYILMERIHPPLTKSYILRANGPPLPELVDLVSELGVYGVVIGDGHEITVNKQVGHMLRTKGSNVNEGGVAAGFSALDSPYLID